MSANATLTISRDAVSDSISHDKHTRGTKLLSEISNAVSNQSIVNIHISLMSEHIQVTLCNHFKSKGKFLCLLFLLLFKLLIQIGKRRRLNGITATQIIFINVGQASVNDRFINSLQLTGATHDLLDKGKNKLALCNQRILTVTVAKRQVHSIDMVGRSRGKIDGGTSQSID